MSLIDILKGLLQSTCNTGSNGVSFVMLSALVIEPFDTKLSTLVDGRNFLKMGWGFRRRTKMSMKKLWCHVLTFWRVYCNLHTNLVQMIYHLSCWVHWSQSLSTQNFPHWLTAEISLQWVEGLGTHAVINKIRPLIFSYVFVSINYINASWYWWDWGSVYDFFVTIKEIWSQNFSI